MTFFAAFFSRQHIALQILCLCFCIRTVSAQIYKPLATSPTVERTDFYNRQQARVQSNTLYTVAPDFEFTSVAVNISADENFAGAYLIAAQDTFFLREDEHRVAEDSIRQSQLIIFEKVLDSFVFYPAGISGNVSFSLINAENGRAEVYARMQQNKKKKQTQQPGICEQPTLVSQSVWRAGLPAPSYQRVETSVRHVIVHHSAGSNTNTDYANTVRNIYLFHTQDRGWSDIGYNFLIGQDGSIFQGRSFGDSSLDSDNIRGAHFCGQNSGTMGICMLGNFNTAVPSDTSVASLNQLISWKLQKESLQPFEEYVHPANARLSVVAAHRNGCATECPGDNLYVMLDRIRLEVESLLEGGCEPEVPTAFSVYPIPAENELNISLPEAVEPETFHLVDALGQRMEVSAYQQEDTWIIETVGIRAGFYVLLVDGTGFSYERKLLIH